ncbi:hypothetical protein HDV00_005974 [Rhizophlyctis rosea]|nr:hypothetical protein HDV00_005974 [Rhizophlyctis rosea]
MMGIPLDDKPDADEDGVYDKLLQRVNEALGRSGIAAENSSTSDMEASLLHKVEEVLSALGSGPDGHRDGRTDRAGTGGADDQDRRRRDALRVLAASTSLETTSSTGTYELSPRHLALDLSLADGTYRMEDPTQMATMAGQRVTPNNYSPLTPQYKRSSDVLNPILEASSAFEDSLLEAGRIAPSASKMRDKDNDGLKGPSVDIPRIEYESFVDDDTLAERALAPLLAKYLPPELLPTVQKHPRQSSRHTSPYHVPTTISAYPHSRNPPFTNNELTTAVDQTSVDFEDQLSLASLEYMKRHQLDRTSSSSSPTSTAAAAGAQGQHLNGHASNQGTLGRTMGVARGEQTTRILNVESIRKLPKLR